MTARIIVVALLLLFAPRVARAERCGDEAQRWVARCASSSGLSMKLAECPSSVAIVEVGTALRVEISTSTTAFRRVGAHGISPVGSFPDWKLEPQSTRDAFDAVLRCAEREPPDALLPRDASPPPSSGSGRPLWPPFLVVGAVVAALFIGRPRARPAALAAVSIVATVLLRRLLQSIAYFHQNGQGPEWIRFAIGGDAGAYGPGYPELFSWIAARAARPDRAVFVAQELLAATIPVAAYAIVREVRGPRVLGLAVGLALALDPVLMRTARSESYYVAATALLFTAAALIVTGDRVRRLIPAAIAAGLLVAQAARVHPVAWVASAMIVLPVAVRPGRLRDRGLRLLAAAAIVAVVAAPFVWPTIRGALRSEFGESMRQARVMALQIAPLAVFAVALFAGATAVPRTRAIGSRLLVFMIVVSAAIGSNLLSGNIPAVHAAYLHLFLPAAIGSAAAALSFAPPRAAAIAVVALAALHIRRERPAALLTTDAYELAWCLEWRETLPSDARVASLRRAGHRTLMLPLYGQQLPRWEPVDDATTPIIRPTHYYRGSLCATPEGAPICAAVESRYRLRPIASRRIPSRQSASWLPLPAAELEVTLYEIDQ